MITGDVRGCQDGIIQTVSACACEENILLTNVR